MNDETTTEMSTEVPTTAWPGELKAMNQLAETTTVNEMTTIYADTTEIPTTIFAEISTNKNEKLKSTTPSTKSEESSTLQTEESTTQISTSTLISDSTTMNEPFLTTTFDSLTTTEIPYTTTETATDETTTFESTSVELDDRIDPKVIATLLG
jgi:hypothetical protein